MTLRAVAKVHPAIMGAIKDAVFCSSAVDRTEPERAEITFRGVRVDVGVLVGYAPFVPLALAIHQGVVVIPVTATNPPLCAPVSYSELP